MNKQENTAETDRVNYVSLSPFLTSLIKPSADYLGQELRSFISEHIDCWKKRKQSQNLRSHIESTRGLLESAQGEEPGEADTLEQLELFEDWVEGAQDVDPREKELSCMWRELLNKGTG